MSFSVKQSVTARQTTAHLQTQRSTRINFILFENFPLHLLTCYLQKQFVEILYTLCSLLLAVLLYVLAHFFKMV